MEEGIVCFAFGTPGRIKSNRALSDIVYERAACNVVPVLTQKDLIGVSMSMRVEFVREDPKNPASTLDIAHQAVAWAMRRDIQKLQVVAAPQHLWRVLRDLEYAIGKAHAAIEVEVAPEVHDFPEETWYCADSGQRFHRSKKVWDRYDRIMRVIPMQIYVFVYARLRQFYAP